MQCSVNQTALNTVHGQFGMGKFDEPQVSALCKCFAANFTDVVPNVEVDHLKVFLLVGDVGESLVALGALEVLVAEIVSQAVATVARLIFPE